MPSIQSPSQGPRAGLLLLHPFRNTSISSSSLQDPQISFPSGGTSLKPRALPGALTVPLRCAGPSKLSFSKTCLRKGAVEDKWATQMVGVVREERRGEGVTSGFFSSFPFLPDDARPISSASIKAFGGVPIPCHVPPYNLSIFCISPQGFASPLPVFEQSVLVFLAFSFSFFQ